MLGFNKKGFGIMKTPSEIRSQYHVPGCSNINKRPVNGVFISPSNSLEHEILKLKTCYEFRKLGIPFITEAVDNKTKPYLPARTSTYGHRQQQSRHDRPVHQS